MGLARVALMLEVATNLGRLASGYDPDHPLPEPLNHDAALRDLKRIYGDHAARSCEASASD